MLFFLWFYIGGAFATAVDYGSECFFLKRLSFPKLLLRTFFWPAFVVSTLTKMGKK